MRGINSWKLRSFEHFDFNLTLLGDESVIFFREKERERECWIRCSSVLHGQIYRRFVFCFRSFSDEFCGISICVEMNVMEICSFYMYIFAI